MSKIIKIECEAKDLVSIDEIKDLQGDLKELSKDEYRKLIKSIIEKGYTIPNFVWKDKKGDIFSMDGKHRILALKDLISQGYSIEGSDKIPVAYINAKNKREAVQKLLLINSHNAKIEEQGLYELLTTNDIMPDYLDDLRLVDVDIEQFKAGFFNDKEEGLTEEDEIPEIDEGNIISQRGDIWTLGNHRLMCGDSTSKEDVEKLMDGNKADMVFTDPPYGMKLDADWSDAKSSVKFASEKNALGGNKHRNVIGDHDDFTPELINTVFENFGYCKEIFLWGADYYAELLRGKNEGSWVVWDKRLDESTDKMYGSTFELCWSKARHKRMIARVKWAGIFGTEQEFDHKRYHPTQKPTALIDWFFDYYSIKDKTVIIDLYGGAGATIISSEKNNKHCYSMELDEKYCDVILKRWAEYTGKDPVRHDGIKWSELQ